jgi:hypothetical protein
MRFYPLRSFLKAVWWFRQQASQCEALARILGAVAPLHWGTWKPIYTGDDSTEMDDERLVNIEALIPGIRLDIRYATVNNFTQRKLYPIARCYLRKRVAERLAEAPWRITDDGTFASCLRASLKGNIQ